MNAKHTPGPWRVFDSPGVPNLRVAGPTKKNGTAIEVCILGIGEDARFYAGGPERAANARLIASAPALLAALERLANAASVYAGLDPAVASARAAIARAKGGAS